MAQSGYTPILIYASGTASNVPLAANMTSSASGAELALNYADGKLYYKDSGGVVQVLATKGAGTIGGSNTQVQYNSSGALAGSANMTFNGTTLTVAGFSNTGNTILGDASADTVTVNGTITSNLIFTDNTYDIGASGATRPRTLYLGTSLITPSITNSGLTSGRVTFAGTGGLLSDSANLFWDNTNAALGVGITSPNTYGKLSVSGGNISVLAGSSLRSYRSDNATYNEIKYVTSGDLFYLNQANGGAYQFNISGSEQVRLNTTGLGIGVSPTNKLSVYAGGIVANFGAYGTGAYDDFEIQAYSGYCAIGTRGSTPLVFNIARAEVGRFTNAGNFALGATTASGKLDVTGRTYMRASGSDSILTVLNQSGGDGTISVTGASNTLNYGFSTFSTSNALYIANAGNIGIGTNNPGAYSGRLVAVNSATYPNTYAVYSTDTAQSVLKLNYEGGTSFTNGYKSGVSFGSDQVPNGSYAAQSKWFVGIYSTADGVGNSTLAFYDQKNSYLRMALDMNSQLTLGNSNGPLTMNALKPSGFGYSQSSYGALVVGTASGSNVTVCINVDPIANTSPNFSGNGGEVMFRNNVQFITPNAANTSFLGPMQFSPTGNVLRPLQSAFMATGDYAVWTTYGVDANFYVPTNSTGAADGTVSGVNAGFAMTASGGLRFNVGSSYNAATGLFTAPVAGKYFFFSAGLFRRNSTTASDYVQLQLVVNGSQNYAGWDQQPYLYTGSSGMEWVMKVSCFIDLAANDTVSMRFTKSGTIQAYAQRFVFGGYLL